jgi:lysophospholipase L1-like esterase
MSPSRVKKHVTVFLVNTALLFLGVLVLELIFGNWLKENNINQLNVIRDISIKYELHDLYEFPQTTITYTRDKYGLRGNFNSPSEITILTVGGSTTDQRYITDELTWQNVLQQEFNNIGKKVVVANAGIDGQSSFGHIKDFDWWFPNIPGLKPKYVLFYIGINDFHKDAGREADSLLREKADRSLLQLLRDKSAIYYAGRTMYGIYLAEIRDKAGHRSVDFRKEEWVLKPRLTAYDALMDKRLKEYEERLEVLVRKTEQIRAVPIFVTQPTRKFRLNNGAIEGAATISGYDGALINGMDFYHMMTRLNRVTCAVAERHGSRCVDLSRELLPELEDRDFYDFGHMTPQGARKVGRRLFEVLKDEV